MLLDEKGEFFIVTSDNHLVYGRESLRTEATYVS